MSSAGRFSGRFYIKNILCSVFLITAYIQAIVGAFLDIPWQIKNDVAIQPARKIS